MRKLAIAFVLSIILPASVVHAQVFAEERDALVGLEGVYVMGGDLDDEMAKTGLIKADVLTAVMSKLNGGGIHVLDETEWLMLDDAPVLHVDLLTRIDDEHHRLYSVRVEVLFLVNPVTDRSFSTYAVLWGDGNFGLLDSANADDILGDIDRIIDRLLIDFHEANSI